MKSKLVASILLMAGLTAFGSNAMSSDEFAGALLGGGTGAVLGHMVGGRDGAFVGGFIGAMVGAAAADDDDDERHRGVRGPRRDAHVPPVAVYQAPRVRYVQPVFTQPNPPQHWRYERIDRHDNRRNDDHDGWREERRHGERFGERYSESEHHGDRGYRRGW